MEWISVKEYLPPLMKDKPYSHHVLTLGPEGQCVCYYMADFLDSAAWILAHGYDEKGKVQYINVTHWQPLPPRL